MITKSEGVYVQRFFLSHTCDLWVSALDVVVAKELAVGVRVNGRIGAGSLG